MEKSYDDQTADLVDAFCEVLEGPRYRSPILDARVLPADKEEIRDAFAYQIYMHKERGDHATVDQLRALQQRVDDFAVLDAEDEEAAARIDRFPRLSDMPMDSPDVLEAFKLITEYNERSEAERQQRMTKMRVLNKLEDDAVKRMQERHKDEPDHKIHRYRRERS